MPGNFQQEQTFDDFLSLLNVNTVQEARQLSSSALIKANIQQVGASPYGDFTYGPVVDGLFAPGIPGKLLLQGSFDHDLKLILGHNADEGLDFTSPFVSNDTAYDAFIKASFPDVSTSVASYIEEELYPPPPNSTLYRDETGRTSLSISESTFVCNTLYLDRVCTTFVLDRKAFLTCRPRLLETKRTPINLACLLLFMARTSLIRSSMG